MSGVPETGVTFFKFGGHNHDGVNSTEINTSNYSIFDFGTGIGTQNGDTSREKSRSLNQIRFNGYIANFISSQILAPAGIVLSENSVTGRNIGAREITADKIVANTITANEIKANTITANNIAANTITANQIAADSITSSELSANAVVAGKIAAGVVTANNLVSDISLINNVIRSQNYVAGSAGWKIANTGTVEFSSGTFRGTISASAGTIGGWTIDTNKISAGTTILYANGDFESGTFGSNLAIMRNGTGTFVGGSQQSVNHEIANIMNSNVSSTSLTNGSTFSANSAGYLRSLYGQLGDLGIGTSTLNGTNLSLAYNALTVGNPVAGGGSAISIANNGSIIFKYNGAAGPFIAAVGANYIMHDADRIEFKTDRFDVISPTATVAMTLDLPTAGATLTNLGIDASNKIFINTSKRSAKYDIATFNNSVDIVKQLNPVTYKWRSNALESDLVKYLKDNDNRYGFILEDVESVSKSLVTYSYDGPSTTPDDEKFSDPTNFSAQMFDANGILSVVTSALKELIERVEILEAVSGG